MLEAKVDNTGSETSVIAKKVLSTKFREMFPLLRASSKDISKLPRVSFPS
jgi:hypothetical protein